MDWLGLETSAAMVAIAFGILGLYAEAGCHDALLVPPESSRRGGSSAKCPHSEQTLVRDGDAWRCVCPNTSRDPLTPERDGP